MRPSRQRKCSHGNHWKSHRAYISKQSMKWTCLLIISLFLQKQELQVSVPTRNFVKATILEKMTEQGKKIINQNQGWIKVKSKGTKKTASYSPSISSSSSTLSGSTNRFVIPTVLEKKLHNKSAITSLVGVKGPGSKKCRKRNQRRNRKRAERRAMRDWKRTAVWSQIIKTTKVKWK